MPGSPNQSSTLAISSSTDHCVGTHGDVANDDSCPGSRNDHPPRNSWPSLRWNHMSVLSSGSAACLVTRAMTRTTVAKDAKVRTLAKTLSSREDASEEEGTSG